MLADDAGARLIVTVSTHATLTEVLDKGRDGNASSFLTRLRVGDKLIDARVVRLYRSRISTRAAHAPCWGCARRRLTTALVASPSGRAILSVARAL
jgi:uncharacterized membrane-anchored protein